MPRAAYTTLRTAACCTTVPVILDSGKAAAVEGMILTGEMHEHNTFDNPDQVKCTSFDDVKLTDDGLKLTLPKCSVLHLTVTVE